MVIIRDGLLLKVHVSATKTFEKIFVTVFNHRANLIVNICY